MSSIPPSVLEAATIDGANYWQRAFRVVIPMLVRQAVPQRGFLRAPVAPGRSSARRCVYWYLVLLSFGEPSWKTP